MSSQCFADHCLRMSRGEGMSSQCFVHHCLRMSGGEGKVELQEVLPKQGLVYQEDMPTVVLCKPKLLPLKSVTLEKMEKMQKEAMEEVKAQELKELGQDAELFKGY